jgi:beta-1,4-mannosyl-glycoprotein beta-1,4-N-acetylglucosaminyltransferase
MIIDAFLFYNEFDLLEYRLELLYEYVDWFILVESKKTFMGKENENCGKWKTEPRYQKYMDKMIHVELGKLKYENPDENQVWENEYFQRNCINMGLQKIANMKNLQNEDILIISDVDEIPNPYYLLMIKSGILKIYTTCNLEQDFYYYSLNFKKRIVWNFAKITNYYSYVNECQSEAQTCRYYQCRYKLSRGGYHLSYFGDVEKIKNKIQNFSHQEYNHEDYLDEEKIRTCLESGKDLFGRMGEDCDYIPILENPNLPPLYYKYLSSFFDKRI